MVQYLGISDKNLEIRYKSYGIKASESVTKTSGSGTKSSEEKNVFKASF